MARKQCIVASVSLLLVAFMTIPFSLASAADAPAAADQPKPPATAPAATQPAPTPDLRDDLGKIDLISNEVAPELKKMDVNRIGASPYYEVYEGCRLGTNFPLKYFTVATRCEIYQEAKPIDSHIMDAKAIRFRNQDGQDWKWNTDAHYRSQTSKPVFTRAYGVEITLNDPKNKEGQIKYTHDYRDIYGGQTPLYLDPPDRASRNCNYNVERWDQNEILFMHSKKIPGIEWQETINLGYRYSTNQAKNDMSWFNQSSYYENRHTYFFFGSLAPTERLEFFGQYEYFKSRRVQSEFPYDPDHYFWAAEIRMRSKDLKTMWVPRYSYSKDYYLPFNNRFSKQETSFRVGHDFTKKLNMASTIKYIYSERNEVDFQSWNVPPGYTAPKPDPENDTAAWAGIENRVQYNIFHKFWLQGGIDYSAGMNMSDFDNLGYMAGIEFYAPGLLRVDVGWRGNQYYQIDDFLSTIYFKVYLFM